MRLRCVRAKINAPHGFTLIELIGVLTVVAILAGLLVPRVFTAIHNAGINQTATSLNSLKTACVGHYAKYSSLAIDGSLSPPATIVLDGTDARSSQFDKVLLSEALVDSIFSPRIGDRILGSSNTRVQIVTGLSSSAAPDQDNSAYSFDGNGNNEASGGSVVEAIITGVSPDDARALNDVIDGPSLGEDSNGNDFAGRVKYANPNSSSGSGGANNSGSGSGTGSGSGNGSGNGNGNGNGLGNGNGNDGHNNGNGNGGVDNGHGNGNTGNGNSNGSGSGSSGGSGTQSGTQTVSTLTVHIYLTHH
jgi:prepilin-type N-terminal cleavage/methylation domain-containing protein